MIFHGKNIHIIFMVEYITEEFLAQSDIITYKTIKVQVQVHLVKIYHIFYFGYF